MTTITRPTVPFSRFDGRDYKYLASGAPVPARVDLRKPTHIIKDQDQAGACTGHNSTSGLEIMGQMKAVFERLSPQFAYTMTRDAEGRQGLSGTYSMRDILETLRKAGVCLESEMPYIDSEADTQPSAAANASGLTRLVGRYEAVPLALTYNTSGPSNVAAGVANVKAALASGLPVMIALAIGIKLPQMNMPLAQQFYTPVAKPWLGTSDPYADNPYYGGHALLLVGYDDALGGFIAQNSWGVQHGDGGYNLLQYQVLQDFSEAWVVRKYAGMSFQDDAQYAARMQVVRLYVAILGRAPELAGLLYWAGGVQAGYSLVDAANGMLPSPECRAKFATDGDVINAMILQGALFENRVTVAAYCALDLACDQASVYMHALDTVTADPATIEPAKLWIRTHMAGGGGTL
jgi:hypothetical protein